nr:sensor histidine kinase [Micromonospora sp. DSM 115978]
MPARVRGLPPIVVDAVIALACYLAMIASSVVDGHCTADQYLLSALGSLPLVWRRRWPIPVTLVTGVATIALALSGLLHEMPYGQLVATYTFASLSTPRWRAIAASVSLAGIFVSLLPKENLLPASATIILFVAAYALGAIARSRRELIATLEARARQLAADYARAAATERERIARDMHDILAHSVSLIVVQAEAGPVVVRGDPDRAATMFDAIADAGRDALAQLRRTLNVLRPESASRAPQPDLDSLGTLVEQARGAGVRTTLDEYGDRRPIAPETAVAAYRVVQESLTNVVKHAHAGQVGVRLHWDETALRLEVRDDGRGDTAPVPHLGHGLIGMRERVAACGGTLSTGSTDDGPGFRVAATLPLLESR